jgi:hypothetical protein
VVLGSKGEAANAIRRVQAAAEAECSRKLRVLHTDNGGEFTSYLAFSVGYVSRFMQRLTTEHQQAVKRIIRYVAETLHHGIYYPRCPREAHLVGYNDSDHASDIDTSKSTSGILFFFGKCLVSWQSVKQQVVALSSCEAEYITASTASTQPLWFVRLLRDLLGRDTGAVELRVDSKSALALAKNPVFHERSKHIRVRYHFI